MTIIDETDVAPAPEPGPQSEEETEERQSPADIALAAAGLTTDDLAVPLVNPSRIALAAFFAASATGWMLGGAFVGWFARGMAVVTAAGFALLAGLSYRTRRPSSTQLVLLPLSIGIGAIACQKAAGGGAFMDLVQEALRGGGLSQPPVPFDPGWRFIVIVIVSSITVAATSSAVSYNKSHLAVFVPGIVAFAAVGLQPTDRQFPSVIVALGLILIGMAIASGAEMAKETSGAEGKFEIQRLLKAVISGGVLIGVLMALSNIGFLFPSKAEERTVPPQRPQTPPPGEDKLLFRAEGPVTTPWRVGVLDVYQNNAWMTPPFNPARFVKFDDVPDIAKVVPDDKAEPGAVVAQGDRETIEVTFTVENVAGRVIPDLAGTLRVEGDALTSEYDPRTQTLRMPGRPRAGTKYTVTAVQPPSLDQLADAPQPTGDTAAALAEYLQAPPIPPAVKNLLDTQPPESTPFDKMQALREKLYSNITAAGAGDPKDLPPEKVDNMIRGPVEATPYEIIAAEGLVARWAGVPSRIGYGYFGGDAGSGKALEVHKKHGAVWLEVYAESYGWVPIVGKPEKAKSSLNTKTDKNADPDVVPTDELAARIYVPTRSYSVQPIFVWVRYWLGKLVPPIVIGVVIWGLYPAFLRKFRRIRRRRWATNIGPRARIAVAYANFRDLAIDLNLGHPSLTPFEFCEVIEPDDDHVELAWISSRALWADLVRDTTELDAKHAEKLQKSLRSRLYTGQPYLNRFIAFSSRASLRDPFDRAVPNFWFGRSKPQIRPVVVGMRTRMKPKKLTFRQKIKRQLKPKRVLVGGLVALILIYIFTAGRPKEVDLNQTAAAKPVSVPKELDGGFTLERSDKATKAFRLVKDVSLVSSIDLYSIKNGDGETVGTFQAAEFKPGVLSRLDAVQKGVREQLGGQALQLTRLGGEPVWTRKLPDQRHYLWFSPDGSDFELLVATNNFEDPESVLVGILAEQKGVNPEDLQAFDNPPPVDQRRGI